MEFIPIWDTVYEAEGLYEYLQKIPDIHKMDMWMLAADAKAH